MVGGRKYKNVSSKVFYGSSGHRNEVWGNVGMIL